MTTNKVEAPANPKAMALILGKHDHISKWVIDVIRADGYDGKNSTTVEGVIELAANEHFDVLMLGGAVTSENARLAEEGVRNTYPTLVCITKKPMAHQTRSIRSNRHLVSEFSRKRSET
jgi:hypothetical protein